MKEDQLRFLALMNRLPGRLTAEQAGWVLNCQPHDIPALVSARLLKPLGNPPPNAIKFFCTADVLEGLQDRAWLGRVTSVINQHWQKQNAKKKGRGALPCPIGDPTANTLEGNGTYERSLHDPMSCGN